MVGTYSTIGKTLVLTDDNGNEVTGVIVGQEVIFTANAAEDIREGKVAATDEGVVTGAAIIPNYETTTGKRVVTAGGQFKISDLGMHDIYNYTELQCIICPFSSSIDASVAAEKVVIGDNVYNVNSAAVVSTVIKNSDDKAIDFNFTNTTNSPYIIRYFTYKQIYG